MAGLKMNWLKPENLYKLTAFVGLVIYFLCGACPLPSAAAPAPSDKQEGIALDYRLKISRNADPLKREALYLGLIDECPETELAEESYWLLSNLYLDDFDEPKEDKAKEILEAFLKRYPKSRWFSHVKNRLQWLNGEAVAVP